MPAHGGREAYRYGEWEIDLAKGELRVRGMSVPIGRRACEIIEVLVQSAGELVTKNELMNRVWPGMFVEDNTLQVHISAIRKAFGPDRGMLRTESGRGYRLLGDWTIRQNTIAPDPERIPVPAQPILTNLPAAASDLIGRTAVAQHLRSLLSAYRSGHSDRPRRDRQNHAGAGGGPQPDRGLRRRCLVRRVGRAVEPQPCAVRCRRRPRPYPGAATRSPRSRSLGPSAAGSCC